MSKKISYTSMFAVIIYILTLINIKLPFGYVHLGDAGILLACYILPMPFAVFATALGSSMADITLGYTAYAIPTFIIKGLMALIIRSFVVRSNNKGLAMTGFVVASLFMHTGYLIFNSVMYGEALGIGVVLANLSQTFVAIPLGYILLKSINRVHSLRDTREIWREKNESKSIM